MKKEKEIPLKNYILLSIVLILTIVVVIYFFLWKNTYEKSKLQTPILDDYLLVINYNELNNYLKIEGKNVKINFSSLYYLATTSKTIGFKFDKDLEKIRLEK